MYKPVVICMLVILSLLMYRFWLGDDSIFKTRKLSLAVKEQDEEVTILTRRNEAILDHIRSLKEHPNSIEEQARYELGMVRKGEKYYQIVEGIE